MAELTDEQRAEQLADELLALFAKVPHLTETILPKLLTFEVGLSKHDHHLRTMYVENLTKHSKASWTRAETQMAREIQRRTPPSLPAP